VEKAVRYAVVLSRKSLKNLDKMPGPIVQKFFILAEQLRNKGPFAPNWSNYSKLGKHEYHCHLAYNWVACWRHEANTLIIEVYYVGSRQNAPY
jgi:hypothetical protein